MEGIKCITELPEECMSHILSLTSPRDAARSAVLSSEFRSAANSDIVWGSFLPSGFEEIISKLESPLVFSSKKDLYLHFCNGPFLLKDNTKSFWLDKATGKKCYMLGGREVSISLENVTSYWRWMPQPSSRVPAVAKLMIDCSLKIKGKMKRLGGYGGDFRRVHTSEQQQQYEEEVPHMRKDGWLELEMGSFFNDKNEDDELEMEMRNFHIRTPKSGLILEGVELRPTPTPTP
ncbi:F-box protein PP2-B10 [Vitis vinifera]|uniref:F-box protein PP2-B10 n=1 Tax=Vitis vinifera TaxID=29760 RepID=A0A438DTA0_VITVI|nr:F-box protein PP2-B10 [Vitis vinifera]